MTQTIVRNIIRIDTDLCTGCGQCVLDCAEGAIAIVDGKARVVSESYCDGLGACLAGCPTDALAIEAREAAPFDEDAAMAHVTANMPEKLGMPHQHALQDHAPAHGAWGPAHGGCPGATPGEFRMAPVPADEHVLPCGCPGSAMRELSTPAHAGRTPGMPSRGDLMSAPMSAPADAFIRKTWPVKLRLLPPSAPFLAGADILLAADCAPTASPHFHALLGSKLPIIACPKFEDNGDVLQRLKDIFTVARPASVTVMRMEVPCCRGIASLAFQAAMGIETREIVLGCNGEVVSNRRM